MPSSSTRRRPQTHYSVLGLAAPPDELKSSNDSKLVPKATKLEIKHAYHRALLYHHPDKKSIGNASSWPSGGPDDQNSGQVTVDEILKAFQTLSNDESRKQYDRELTSGNPRRMRTSHLGGCHSGKSTSKNYGIRTDHGEVEEDHSEEIIYKSLDLDDMSAEETLTGDQVWFYSCRCGLSRGYTITEEDLERESQHGETEAWAQCSGCSLWIMVAYEANGPEDQVSKE